MHVILDCIVHKTILYAINNVILTVYRVFRKIYVHNVFQKIGVVVYANAMKDIMKKYPMIANVL